MLFFLVHINKKQATTSLQNLFIPGAMEFSLQVITAIAFFFSVVFFFIMKKQTFITPINWPLVGMLPHLLLNTHRLFDWILQLLQHSNGTFLFKGPWFSSMELLLTLDPANVHYVLSKNFANFPKGPVFSKIFDILGDGIFNVDFEQWSYQRKLAHSFLSHPRFHRFLAQTVSDKAENGLIPVIESAYKEGRVIDLEDIFQRFTFDTICRLVEGNDPCSLSIDLPEAPFCKALDEAEEVLLLRHVVPEIIWKLQRWLGIGSERKMKRAWKVLDGFIYKALELKRQEMKKNRPNTNDHCVDLLTLYLEGTREGGGSDDDDLRFSDKFLRDLFLNLLIAGRDTTSAALTWFFWLLHKNPRAETKIREELASFAGDRKFLQVEELNKLTYLHGALCETLRLYPSVPLEQKTPLEPVVLPSGHRANRNTKIIFSLYAMGRSESIWGDDCLEFKPERWITDKGKIKHEPSYKFLAFNAGPRTCLGKDMAFTQMKAVVSSILLNGYRVRVMDEHKVEPDVSIILHTRHGLKARILKRVR